MAIGNYAYTIKFQFVDHQTNTSNTWRRQKNTQEKIKNIQLFT